MHTHSFLKLLLLAVVKADILDITVFSGMNDTVVRNLGLLWDIEDTNSLWNSSGYNALWNEWAGKGLQCNCKKLFYRKTPTGTWDILLSYVYSSMATRENYLRSTQAEMVAALSYNGSHEASATDDFALNKSQPPLRPGLFGGYIGFRDVFTHNAANQFVMDITSGNAHNMCAGGQALLEWGTYDSVAGPFFAGNTEYSTVAVGYGKVKTAFGEDPEYNYDMPMTIRLTFARGASFAVPGTALKNAFGDYTINSARFYCNTGTAIVAAIDTNAVTDYEDTSNDLPRYVTSGDNKGTDAIHQPDWQTTAAQCTTTKDVYNGLSCCPSS